MVKCFVYASLMKRDPSRGGRPPKMLRCTRKKERLFYCYPTEIPTNLMRKTQRNMWSSCVRICVCVCLSATAYIASVCSQINIASDFKMSDIICVLRPSFSNENPKVFIFSPVGFFVKSRGKSKGFYFSPAVFFC